MSDDLFLDIAFSLNVESTFQYRCPPELADRALPGMRVLAPLRGRPTPGVIVATGREAKVGRVLPIHAIPDGEPLLPPALMDTIGWVAGRYLASIGLALHSAVPAGVLRSATAGEVSPGARRILVEPLPGAPDAAAATPKQRAALDRLAAQGAMPAARLVKDAGIDYRTLHLLERRGWIRLVPSPGEPAGTPCAAPVKPVALSGEQSRVKNELGRALAGPSYGRFILQGPPGSGKMEAFLQALAANLPPDRQALILVPEVSLTPPLIARLEALFPGKTAVFHHGIPEGRRLAAWWRCRRGEVRVALGSRSAVFLPLPRPGIIFVDEEQEPSYKAEETPRYHAREVALERARREGIPVVLSSAALSVETHASLTQADTVTFALAPPPGLRGTLKFAVVDLQAERGSHSAILSGQMVFSLRETLARGWKAILFVNRLGLAAAAFCADCCYTPRCPRCTTALALPDEGGSLICRVCGHQEPVATICPRCGGTGVRTGSPGTRGVEREVLSRFPDAKTAVFDRDSTARAGSLERIIDDFTRGPVQVLIGTQMATRGHHWPRVGLVGVIDADAPLHHPDFRSAERAYQLLTQAAGLAGWGLPRARVVIQTHHPDHYALEAVVQGKPELFYRRELELRREVGFPPFASLALITLEGEEGSPLDDEARRLRAFLEAAARTGGPAGLHPGAEPAGMEILGPHAATARHRSRRHRRQILVKGASPETVRDTVRGALRDLGPPRGNTLKVSVDIDPVDFR